MERILVIDDDPAVQTAVRRTLEPSGYEIVAAADGGHRHGHLSRHSARFVVLDLCLPGKSGQDLCREIRAESTTVPIIVLSALSDEIEKVVLLELGAIGARASGNATSREAVREPGVFRFNDVEVNFSRMQAAKILRG